MCIYFDLINQKGNTDSGDINKFLNIRRCSGVEHGFFSCPHRFTGYSGFFCSLGIDFSKIGEGYIEISKSE